MDLTSLSTHIRPRNGYEAMDLGFVLVREWWWPLQAIWLSVTLPLFLLVLLAVSQGIFWPVILFWWLIPLAETLLLHYVARRIFDPSLRWASVLQQAPTLLRHQTVAKLLPRRLSLSRTFDMPVGELERLAGVPRNRRLNALHRNTSSAAIWLTFLASALELLLILACVTLMLLMVPESAADSLTIDTLLDKGWLFPLLVVFWYLALTLITPYFVACGFCLYINRRTELEGWDIELTFRQLASRWATPGPRSTARRVGNVLPAVLLTCLSLVLSTLQPSAALADTPETDPATHSAAPPLTRDSSRRLIIDVLEGDDFNRFERIEHWRQRNPEPEETSGEPPDWLTSLSKLLGRMLEVFAYFSEFILWGALLILVVLFGRQLARFRGRHIAASQPPKKPPEVLFGLDIRRESLPDDPAAEALRLWQQQQPRAALSLLYRAALVQLVEHPQVDLLSSHTEQECVQVAATAQVPAAALGYFQSLTRYWVQLAYGHRGLDSSDFIPLQQQWAGFAKQMQEAGDV